VPFGIFLADSSTKKLTFSILAWEQNGLVRNENLPCPVRSMGSHASVLRSSTK
jgi:hypothetical protein